MSDHGVHTPAYYELLSAATLRLKDKLSFFEQAELISRLTDNRVNSPALRHFADELLRLYFSNIESGFAGKPEGVLSQSERAHLLPNLARLREDIGTHSAAQALEGPSEQSKTKESSREVKAVVELLRAYLASLDSPSASQTREVRETVRIFNRRFKAVYTSVDPHTLNLLHQSNSLL